MVQTRHIHYRVWNPEGKKNVLLIHGFAASTFSYRKLTGPLVKAGYHVVAIDLPGFGYSTRNMPPDNSKETTARFVWDFIQAYEHFHKTDGNWSLVGHSMGGGITAYMAALKPGKTERYVLIAPALNSGSNIFTRAALYIPGAKTVVEYFAEPKIENREEFSEILKSAYGRKPTAVETEGYRKPLRIPGTARAILDLWQTSGGPSVNYEAIQAPGLVVWGADDEWVEVENADEIRENIKNVRIVILPGTGHNPMETSDEAVAMITEFLKFTTADRPGVSDKDETENAEESEPVDQNEKEESPEETGTDN